MELRRPPTSRTRKRAGTGCGVTSDAVHTHVRVMPFTDQQWDALFDVISSKVAHTAALMDGELSSLLVDDARRSRHRTSSRRRRSHNGMFMP